MKTYKTYHWILFFTVQIMISSCSGIYENGKELAASSKPFINEITVDELDKKFESQDDFLLIDVRQSGEFDKGNIFYSTNIPRGVLEFKIANEAFWDEEFLYPPDKDAEIIVYCKKGDRGVLATRSLTELGYTNVKNLQGGIIAWDPAFDSGGNTKQDEGGCGG